MPKNLFIFPQQFDLIHGRPLPRNIDSGSRPKEMNMVASRLIDCISSRIVSINYITKLHTSRKLRKDENHFSLTH